jgi:CheY-like chemotaxis protein
MDYDGTGESAAALLISRDLFFTSKVTGTAEALGTRVDVVADAESAAQKLTAGEFRCVFIDLADEGLDVAAFFARINRDNRPPVIAFGSHVATARLQAARDAGCDDVMPRSRFSSGLPELLKKYTSAPP